MRKFVLSPTAKEKISLVIIFFIGCLCIYTCVDKSCVKEKKEELKPINKQNIYFPGDTCLNRNCYGDIV